MNDFWLLLILWLLLFLAESTIARFYLISIWTSQWGLIIRCGVYVEEIIGEAIRQGQVVAVETINAPGPHMKARRRLAQTVLHGDLTVSS